ncbi:hypothetical protein ACFPIJ_17240 [Dactylosporangium cerinum]|uniref:Uncharacterized protein n=1 Tax=Dactylosporangium cerinum TaxID=1434730 RepID=A0ABV9VVI7_9ACTN
MIALNGLRCTVWTADEWQAAGDMWKRATVRPLAVLNRLLADVSPVRAHTLIAGGNEGLLLIADPRAVDAMRASGLFGEHGIPALAR